MEILLLSFFVLIASIVGTTSGFGISTIMVPTMLLFFPVSTSLLLVGIIHWFGSLWKLLLFRKGLDLKLILSFGIPGILASHLGAKSVFGVPQEVLGKFIGIVFIFYVLFIFLNPEFKIKTNRKTSVFGGLLYGFMAGLSGVGGAVRSAFLTLYNLPKEVFIATSGAIALFIDTTRVVTYISGGAALEQKILFGFVIFIPTSFLGAKLAKRIVVKIPQDKFRLVIGAFLLVMGIRLLFK